MFQPLYLAIKVSMVSYHDQTLNFMGQPHYPSEGAGYPRTEIFETYLIAMHKLLHIQLHKLAS